MPAQEILTPLQQNFLQQLGRSKLSEIFFLTGGTALSAFFLAHRYSEDLYFFTEQPEQIPQVLPVLENIAQALRGRIEVRRQFKTFLEIFFHGSEGEIIKCDFAQDSPYRLQPKIRQADFGILTDNALDISCNKLSALFDRAEAKDFIDVFFIDRELFPFAELLQHAKQKHVGLDGYWLAISLLKVENLDSLPRMLKPVTFNELKAFFLSQAKLLMSQP
ncbi:nucleotidyl transferase AbiEii/AbiGii toxin family protein [candidate division KSB1 bacterium]|nr:nucleotidyl transferase AbiEii/AbiGii toxin family protein [candidate division KSB1 bacterium]